MNHQNKTLEAIHSRRSYKHFDPDHQMPDDIEVELKAAIMRSPTAFNLQNWRFVLVKDPAVKKEIRAASWDQAQVTDCSLLIVVCADLKAWNKQPERYWRNAGDEVREFMVDAITNYYHNKPAVQRDEGMRSAGMAAQTIMLATESLNYQTCPMDGFDFAKVGEIIGLPEDHLISMFVAVGKATADARPRGGDVSAEEVFYTDSF